MKDWKECPDCWGTGLVGGFQRACERGPDKFKRVVQQAGQINVRVANADELRALLRRDQKQIVEALARDLCQQMVDDMIQTAVQRIVEKVKVELEG